VKLYNEYSKKIKNIFNNKSEAFEKYWKKQNDSETNIEFAHILPRNFCVKQAINKRNNPEEKKKWLEKISDSNNFLPLELLAHKIYDKSSSNIYWDQNGICNNIDKLDSSSEKEIFKNKYLKIDASILKKNQEIVNYLKEYIEYKKNNIS
jgi:hypothetical protein